VSDQLDATNMIY